MKKQEYIKRCLYYKGEEKNPYVDKDFGKSFWWTVERMGREDSKEYGKLTKRMKEYLASKMDSEGYDTSFEEAFRRAEEMYVRGIWSFVYICSHDFTLDMAIIANNKHCLKFPPVQPHSIHETSSAVG